MNDRTRTYELTDTAMTTIVTSLTFNVKEAEQMGMDNAASIYRNIIREIQAQHDIEPDLEPTDDVYFNFINPEEETDE